MKLKINLKTTFLVLVLIGVLLISSVGLAKQTVIRVGYFPNITHAQAVIGMADGSFQKALGKNVKIEKYIFNAGPSVIEAMMSGNLDLAYIGPNPAVNGYIRTQGTLLKIVAGAASGGAALVVRSDLKITGVKQLEGTKIASPQIGNTQDVSLRFYLRENGLKLKQEGGNVEVIPISNPDQLNLFRTKEIHAAWTVEPWVSRLVAEADGKILIDERQLWPDGKFVTANIIVSQKFLAKNQNLVKRWLRAHVDLTVNINKDQRKYQKILNQELKKITGQALPDEIIEQAFSRFELTYDPLPNTLVLSADRAFELGFLGKNKPDLTGIYDLTLLKEILKERKLPMISNPTQK